MAFRPSEQRRFAAQRRARNKPAQDVFETALRDEDGSDDWWGKAATRLVDTATFGHGPEVLAALASPFKGRGSPEQEAALARKRLAAAPLPPLPSWRRRAPAGPPMTTREKIGGGAAQVLDMATFGYGDELLGAVNSPFKGRGTYAEEVDRAKKLRERFRDSD